VAICENRTLFRASGPFRTHSAHEFLALPWYPVPPVPCVVCGLVKFSFLSMQLPNSTLACSSVNPYVLNPLLAFVLPYLGSRASSFFFFFQLIRANSPQAHCPRRLPSLRASAALSHRAPHPAQTRYRNPLCPRPLPRRGALQDCAPQSRTRPN
jgi:hypothetical protein